MRMSSLSVTLSAGEVSFCSGMDLSALAGQPPEVVSAARVPRGEKVTPSLERSTLNPVSLVERSAHVRRISVAPRPRR